MKKYFILLACFLLLFTGTACANVVYVNQGDNTGYIFSDSDPDVKYYINNISDFVTFIAYAAVSRNDRDELELIGDSVHIRGKYTYKYEVLSGGGEVYVYLYRMIDNDWGDELYLQLPEEQAQKIADIVEGNQITKSSTVKSDVASKPIKKYPSVQTVSNYSQIVNNVRADDTYGTMAGLSRVTSRNSVKNLMLLYHPILDVRDTFDNGVSIHNATNLYSNIIYLLDKIGN